MEKKNLFYLSIFFLLLSCQTQKTEKYPEGIEHVIVIGVDALSPDGIRNAPTPVMDSMIENGAIKWRVRTVLTTSSSQNWASMIMGAGPEQHGVISNGWERDDHSLPPIVAGEEGIFPTIFGIIREQMPNAEIGAVYNWSGFGRLFEKKAVNYDKTFSTEDSTTADFTEYIRSRKPTFGFMHLDHVDHAGHHYGHGTPQYYAAVSKADSLIGRVLSGIKDAGIAEKTLVIVTADHGGKGKGHGGPTPEEAEIAMILFGKDVKKGYEIKQQVYTYDLAATIAFAFHLTPPYAWIGRPIKPAFEGFEEPANLWLGKEIITPPVIYPKSVMNEPAGGLYVNEPATVKMSVEPNHHVIHYTVNGEAPDSRSPIYKEPFTIDSTAVIQAIAFDDKGHSSTVSNAYFRLVKTGSGNGLKVSFFKGKDWEKLPSFSTLTPSKTWDSFEFTADENKITPLQDKDNATFGLVFEGYLQIDNPGEYRFFTKSDDGSKLYINDKLVVENDGSHGVMESGGNISLPAGRHKIRVDFFNGIGGYWLGVFYKGPGMVKQLVPADRLFLK